MSNLAKIATGDLSALSSTLDRYKRYAGTYTANTTTKSWEKTADKNNSIALTFKDEAGVNITARLVWRNFPSTLPAGTDTIEDSFRQNIITITDAHGNVVNDTLPNYMEFTITGGQHNLDLYADANLSVIKSKTYSFSFYINYKDYAVDIQENGQNDSQGKSIKVKKNDKTFFASTSYTVGDNLLNYIVDPATYPISERTTRTTSVVLEKLNWQKTQDKASYLTKLKTLKSSGLSEGSEDYAKKLAAIRNETSSSIMYDMVNNAYIGTVTSVPYYGKLKTWGNVSSITLNDKSSHLLMDINPNGVASYMNMQIEELITRLKALTGSK